jgi:hypothetical protein
MARHRLVTFKAGIVSVAALESDGDDIEWGMIMRASRFWVDVHSDDPNSADQLLAHD